MTKILFVCHGNICRSPMAEFVMKDMVRREGVADRFEIASAAVSTEEIGNPVYPPAQRVLNEHGISCKGHHAHQMTRKEYEYYNYVILMDAMNRRWCDRIIGEDDQNKVSLLLEHAGIHRDVADPWYTGNFQATWDDVNLGCKALLEELLGD